MQVLVQHHLGNLCLPSPCAQLLAAHTPWGAGPHTANTIQVLCISPKRFGHSSDQMSLPAPSLPTFTEAPILTPAWP